MSVSPRTRVELYFTSRFGRAPEGVLFLPGRVVLLGEHVDHQGGPILAVPLAQGVYVAWGIRPDRRVALHALNARAADRFDQGRAVRSGRRWADLARGACARLVEEGRRLPGLNLAVFGDLPAQIGLASSAAYTAGILGAALEATEAGLDPRTIARHAAAVEAEWAGVSCGPMDPYVAVAGRPGEVVWLDNQALRHEVYRLPDGVRLDYEDTGIRRRLDETPYNERRYELDRALAALRKREPGLEGFLQLTPERFDALAADLTDPGRRRARHVVTEIQRVARGVEALRAGDASVLGALMRECHESLARDYECSLPEIDRRVEALCAEEGVLGARLQGAGWGGALAVLRGSDPNFHT